MGEEDRASGHRDVGRDLRTILTRPRVDIPEERFVCFEDVLICKLASAREVFERPVNTFDKRAVLKMLNNFGVLFPEHIAQVAARFEIVERVESHDFASRKYLT